MGGGGEAGGQHLDVVLFAGDGSGAGKMLVGVNGATKESCSGYNLQCCMLGGLRVSGRMSVGEGGKGCRPPVWPEGGRTGSGAEERESGGLGQGVGCERAQGWLASGTQPQAWPC